MKSLAAPALAMLLALQAAAASAAVPEFGTQESDRACAGLVGIGLAGASASQPSYPRVVSAMAMALGYYLGRLTKVDPNASKRSIADAVAKLTLDEKNSYANACLKNAAAGMRPALAEGEAL